MDMALTKVVLLMVLSFAPLAYCRGLSGYRFNDLYTERKSANTRNLPARNTEGIYSIFENGKSIYVGRSKDIRSRLQDHLRGGNEQAIDKHLSRTNKRGIKISYVEVKNPKRAEQHFINYMNRRQKEWPKYNKIKGSGR